MRRFNLYQKRGIYYARFKDDDTGRWLSGISTSETDERAALATVALWERDGIPSRDGRSVDSITSTRRLVDMLRGAEISTSDARAIVDLLRERGHIASATFTASPAATRLMDYLAQFWDYDRSAYVREKLAHKHSMTRRHCRDMAGHVHRHWAPFWGDTLLGDVTRDRLREFSSKLADRLHGKSVNNVLDAGRVALRWAHDNDQIPTNPADRLPKFQDTTKRRDVLTVAEIGRLFAIAWPSSSARLASLVAMTCGLRAGEVAALQVDDIGTDRLHVRHSWSPIDGLKLPKNGETREVPLLPALRDALRDHAASNPHGEPFVFWSSAVKGQPTDPGAFHRGLLDALALMSGATRDELKGYHRAKQARSHARTPESDDEISHAKVVAIRAQWSDRGIVFHSWRHFYAARLADRVDLRLVQTATGHKSQAMAEHYASHATAEQFREVGDAARLAFSFIQVSTPSPDADAPESHIKEASQ